MQNNISKRKSEHIKIVLNKETEPNQSPFAKYRLPYKALPEINLSDVDTKINFLNFDLSMPFLISSMTGGPELGETINIHLAEACEHTKTALSLGSMRIILKDTSAIKSFDVKKYCPSIPLIANMGLVQLNYGYGADEINRIIDSVNADAIFLHINPLQESIQPEGDTKFKGLLSKLEKVIPKVNKPILIKEVGTGIDYETAKSLYQIGIKYIDVSGNGGTSWSMVESYRRKDDLGFVFNDFGIPTDEAIISARGIEGLNVIAGGGIRNGVDIAKSIALGAVIATSAGPFLKPAINGSEECIALIEQWKKQLEISMFSTGIRTISEFKDLIYQHLPFDHK
jgi:isopentenyl-diphosphate delta-isomerase